MQKDKGCGPTLSNVNLRELFAFSSSCCVRVVPGERLKYLNRVLGVDVSRNAFARVREVAKELRRLPPKRFVRGKFELWFLVEFIKHLCRQLESAAGEIGGIARVRNRIEHHNAMSVLAPRIDSPPSLTLFLSLHLTSAASSQIPRPSLFIKVLRFFSHLFRSSE
jgi:hypothetical protein